MPLSQAEAPATESLAPPDASWLRPFARILGMQLVYGLGHAVYGLLPTVIVRRFHGDEHDVGVASATLAVGAVALAPFAGLALDRFGRVPLVRLGCAMQAIATATFAVGMAHAWVRLLALFVAGMAFVLVFNGSSALVADVAPPDKIARAVGWQGAVSMITQALSPALAEWAGPRFGWHLPFVAAALLLFAAFLLAGRLDETAPDRGATRFDLPDVRRSALALVPVLIASLLAGGTYASITTFQQPHVLAQGATVVRAYFVGFSGGALLVRTGFGSLADRFGYARTTRASLLAYGAVALGFAFVTPGTLGLAGFLHGLAHGVFYPACVAHAFACVGSRARGLAAALNHGAFNAGHALASVLLGALATQAGTRWVFVVGAGLAFAAIVFVRAPQRGTSTV